VHEFAVVPPAVVALPPIAAPHEMVHVLLMLERILHVPASLISVPQMQAGTPWSGPTSQQLPLVTGPEEQATAVTAPTSHATSIHRSFTTPKVHNGRRAVSSLPNVVLARTSGCCASTVVVSDEACAAGILGR
jgi:hypothetical protein